MEAVIGEGAPLVWPERADSVAFTVEMGDAAFARAHRIVPLRLVTNRLVANYIETGGVLAQLQ